MCLNALEYRVIEVLLSETDELVYGVVPRRPFQTDEGPKQIGASRGGYFFIRPASRITRNVATSSSHLLFDGKTGHIVASLFDQGTASVAFPGTHRCFSSKYTACSGRTSVCGESEAYRISDAAHENGSLFQVFNELVFMQKRHEVSTLADGSEHGFIHLQQHGMKNRPLSDAFISNGCSSSASDGNMPKFVGGSANKLADFLTSTFLEHKTNNPIGDDEEVNYKAMSCNKAEDAEHVKVCTAQSLNKNSNECTVMRQYESIGTIYQFYRGRLFIRETGYYLN